MMLFKPNINALKAKRDLAGLQQLLTHKEVATRRAAIGALNELNARSALPALGEILFNQEAELPEQGDVVETLGKLGDATTIETLLRASAFSQQRQARHIELATSSPARRYSPNFYINRIATDEFLYRSKIAHALAQLGSLRAAEALFEMLARETGEMANLIETEIQNAILRVLPTIEDCLPLLVSKMENADADTRQWAAQCAGKFGDASMTEILTALARNEEETFRVRTTALASLGEIGDRRAIVALEELQKSGNRGLAQDAALAAKRIRDRHPLPPELL